MASGHHVVPVNPLDACVRGYSSVESGAGEGDVAEEALEAALLRQACELAGDTSCAIEGVIPRETALCVSEQIVFGEGRAHRAVLGWHAGLGEAVWTVTEGPETGTCAGRRVTVAADTGRVIGVAGEPGCPGRAP